MIYNKLYYDNRSNLRQLKVHFPSKNYFIFWNNACVTDIYAKIRYF